MTKYFLITFCLLSSFFGFSQEKDSVKAETVDFTIIEDVPIFPGCGKLNKKLQKRCLQKMIMKHVAKNFNASLANDTGLESGTTKLYMFFEIASDGNIKNITAKGEHEKLENEGIRVINLLPKMKPAMYSNKPVGVKYTLPITLKVE